MPPRNRTTEAQQALEILRNRITQAREDYDRATKLFSQRGELDAQIAHILDGLGPCYIPADTEIDLTQDDVGQSIEYTPARRPYTSGFIEKCREAGKRGGRGHRKEVAAGEATATEEAPKVDNDGDAARVACMIPCPTCPDLAPGLTAPEDCPECEGEGWIEDLVASVSPLDGAAMAVVAPVSPTMASEPEPTPTVKFDPLLPLPLPPKQSVLDYITSKKCPVSVVLTGKCRALGPQGRSEGSEEVFPVGEVAHACEIARNYAELALKGGFDGYVSVVTQLNGVPTILWQATIPKVLGSIVIPGAGRACSN